MNRVFNKKIFSYGKFILDNPNASVKERRNALKKFLDYTRGDTDVTRYYNKSDNTKYNNPKHQ